MNLEFSISLRIFSNALATTWVSGMVNIGLAEAINNIWIEAKKHYKVVLGIFVKTLLIIVVKGWISTNRVSNSIS
jgi:ABC-type siderophore export system fused ATPase/permease subunit